MALFSSLEETETEKKLKIPKFQKKVRILDSEKNILKKFIRHTPRILL